MGRDALEKVDWELPGMGAFTGDKKKHIINAIESENIVNSIHSLGWALWPTKNNGYYDHDFLRSIADFIEIQNKPFWDEYNKYCEEQQPCGNFSDEDKLLEVLDDLYNRAQEHGVEKQVLMRKIEVLKEYADMILKQED